jgi:aspartate ammonia-lyase
MPKTRVEKDFLGEKELAAEALYGINTFRSLENFPSSGKTVGDVPELVRAMAIVKQAAARTNVEIGALSADRGQAIYDAAEEVRAGKHNADLVVDVLDGTGGTAINMNFNEVIANLAAIRSGQPIGEYTFVHPNDHVNLGQSTNDTVPTSVNLAVFLASGATAPNVIRIADAFAEKKQQYAKLLRLGRTCLQDAQPMTLGQAFGGYEAALRRHAAELARLRDDMLAVPLGGTAVGTGLGRRAGYKEAVFRHLSALLGAEVRPTADPFDGMQNADSYARLSAELRNTANTLWKICNDLIILSSGPAGGIGEITLSAVQAGSSIMPGKVNPVVAMSVCTAALAIYGNDSTIALGCQQGLLEIAAYDTLVCDRILDSITLLTSRAAMFTDLCVRPLVANEERSWQNLLASSALATALVPKLGYSTVSRLVHETLDQGRSFVDEVVEQGYLKREDIRSTLYAAATDPTEVNL